MFHKAFNGASLARGVAPFEQDHHFLFRSFDPGLYFQQFHLQMVLLFLVAFSRQQILVRILAVTPVVGQFRVGVN